RPEFALASSNTITDCYIYGSTAVYIGYSSTGTVIENSVIVSTGTASNGVMLTDSINLFLSSNVITGGPGGAGIWLDEYNDGTISIASNTILAGAKYGIYISTQSMDTQVWITSNTIIPTVTSAYDTYGIYIYGDGPGGSSIQILNNNVYYRNSGSMGANTSYALYARDSNNLIIKHNRFSQPGMITGGTYIGLYFTGTTNTLFEYNDVHSSGTGLTNACLLELENGSTDMVARNNIFSSSVTVTGSSATMVMDAASQSVFFSDYNNYYTF
ncbi:unnamed protein product, partial [marine sediment metagenome]